jgi:hypothetical protein
VGRKPFRSPDEKLQVVLSVLKGEVTQVEIARRLQMSQFLGWSRVAGQRRQRPRPDRPEGGRAGGPGRGPDHRSGRGCRWVTIWPSLARTQPIGARECPDFLTRDMASSK